MLLKNRAYQHGGSLRGPPILCRAKRNGGLDFSKPPLEYVEWAHEIKLPGNGFFFSAAGQNVTYKTELSKFLFCNNYVWGTICVFITSHIKMNCFQKRYNFFLRIYFYITIIAVSISVSCLHFWQYSGKFSRTVSSRIFNRVLQPQTGHKIHWYHKNIWKPESASKLYAVKPLNRPP